MHKTLIVLFLMCLGTSCLLAEEFPSVDFDKQIAPILQEHCAGCHGENKQESQLRVDHRSSLLRGGDWGEPSIVPGRSEQSFLFRVISGEEKDLVMPPKGKRLTSQEIELIRKWIETGAEMPESDHTPGSIEKTDHWSFQPIVRPDVDVADGQSAIDVLLQAKLSEQGLSFSPAADRRTLIRRLYLVMHGMPPTPEEVAAFVDDERADAWERLVDEVLASPRYGERWARHWLDLIRFGETHGFETNRERPNAWRFRDWVIEALNEDKPYDEFVKEQLVGDALGEPLGTGFLVAGPHDLVKSPDINLTLMQRQDELSDLINATGTTFLGLTLGCARCHNHKFDPITQKDFYSIQAVFAGVQHADRALPIKVEQKQQLAEVDERIGQLTTLLEPFIAKPKAHGDRPAVDFAYNEEVFATIKAKFVRFTILKTTGAQPCIDELEVFAADRNVALASLGSRATSSSNLPGYEIHKLEHINDGQYGNPRSWISNESGGGWVQIEFPQAEAIERIVWARDRLKKYRDRLPTEYEITISSDGNEWTTVASYKDRKPFQAGKNSEGPKYEIDQSNPERAAKGQKWLAELHLLQEKRKTLAEGPKAYIGTFQQPGPTHRLYRGEPMAKREEVAPDAIEVLATLDLEKQTPEQQRRLAFASFVADAKNPLTPRVIVNRLWQFHFGTGIVDTPSDFGANGTPPSHPDVLDWLASELIDNGWSLKQIHREILFSQAWQQSSRPNEDGLKVDAGSRLLWRFPPRRLEAEAIRDSILQATGVLDTTMGGPGFSGFEVEMENVRHFHPKSTYGPEDWRRMIYMTKVRQEQDSVFGVFDCPDASQVMPKRSRSTTPLQALSLLNSSFVQQQAQIFARRIQQSAGDELDKQVELAFELCMCRLPTKQESAASLQFIDAQGTTEFCRALLNTNEFLFIQ